MVELKSFLFEWATASEVAVGKNCRDACRNLTYPVDEDEVGMLVRIMPADSGTVEQRKKRVWGYWDGGEFLKYAGKRCAGSVKRK